MIHTLDGQVVELEMYALACRAFRFALAEFVAQRNLLANGNGHRKANIDAAIQLRQVAARARQHERGADDDSDG